MAKTPMRRLPLKGTSNTRDIGGYPCGGGGVLRWGRFVRSDNPCNLCADDLAFLQEYGIRIAVDLRRAAENDELPSSLYDAPEFLVHSISLKDDLGFWEVDFEGDMPGSMAGFYCDILDNSSRAVADVMRVFIEYDGGFLFHCAVGKDRTGVIAMLLHKLAGVSDADAVCDYALTEIYRKVPEDAQKLAMGAQHIPDFAFRSRPESAERTLQHLQENYGGAREYLRRAGLSESACNKLREKLLVY